MKENLPKGMGEISFEEAMKDMIKNPSKEYLIRGFSIDNVNSIEDEIKVINGYWGNEYRLNKLNQLKEEEWIIRVM